MKEILENKPEEEKEYQKLETALKRIIHGDYSSIEIGTALESISQEVLIKKYGYLKELQNSEDKKVQELAREILSMFPIDRRYEIVQDEQGNYQKRIIQLEEWEILKNKLNSMADWTTEKLAKEFDYLLNCQQSEISSIRDLSFRLALKVMKNWSTEQLAEKIDYLLFCYASADQEIRNSSEKLLLSIPSEKLAKRFGHLLRARKSPDSEVQKISWTLFYKAKEEGKEARVNKEIEVARFLTS